MAYAEVLEGSVQGNTTAAQVGKLRGELREKMAQLIQKATSSEATLAVLRADAESTLDAVRAYEAALAAGPGEATTYWNVFSDPTELGRLRTKAAVRLGSLRNERLNYPPEHIPPSLEFRVREVDGWLKGIEAELNRRGVMSSQIRLKPIRGDLPATEARVKFAAVGSLDGPSGREQNFQRKLALQVQLRLHTAPEDAALNSLRSNLPKITPPEVPSAAPRGPPESAQIARQRLQAAHLEELSAETLRDPLRLAKARAEAAASSEWLAMLFDDPPDADRLGFSKTSSEHLLSVRDGWKNWVEHLSAEKRSNPAASVEPLIEKARGRIREIDAIVEVRLLPRPPPDSGGAPAGIPDSPEPPRGPNVRAYERAWERQVAHLELTELASARNELGPFGDPGIAEAAAKTAQQKVSAEAQLLHDAFEDAGRLQSKLLISGRGPKAAEAGKQLLEARANIQAEAGRVLKLISDTKLDASAHGKAAKQLLTDFARTPQRADAPRGLGRALTSLEIARDAVEASSQPAFVEIQVVTEEGARPADEYRIRLGKMSDGSNTVTQKRPSDYSDLFKKDAGSRTLRELLKDPRRAPGGIVVDATLPEEVARSIQALNIDVNTGVITVNIRGSERSVRAVRDPLLARLAWAFVLDERGALIDLRPLEDDEATWLSSEYGESRMSEQQRLAIVEQLASLISVNVNDALRDTPLVSNLITADQLMFDLLPRNVIRVEGGATRYGMPLDGLRQAFNEDMGAVLNQERWRETLFSKSVLAVSSARCEVGADLLIEPSFSFHLFEVPASGAGAINLKASERWFAAHEGELRRLPQLSRLADFAIMATLFRSVHQQHIPNNLDELVAVAVPEADAPRFILRKNQLIPERWKRLRRALSGQ
jgi:hypothetical protein